MKAKSRRQFTAEFKVKVVLEALRQDKTLSQIASDYDLHPQLVQTWKQTFVTAAPQVFDQPKGAQKPVDDEKEPLYEQIGRLQMDRGAGAIELAQKKTGDQPLSQRRAMIERSHPKLSLRRQCWLLSVSRAGLSYEPVAADEQALQIMRRLDTWYVEHPDLGHRRLVVLLKEEGWAVNIKRVRRLRALMGLETQFPKPNLSKPGVPRQRFFYRLRGLVIDRVHQVWATDITYIPMPKGFFYVMAIRSGDPVRFAQSLCVALAVEQFPRRGLVCGHLTAKLTAVG